MSRMTVLRLRVDFVATEDGGRHGPVFDDYRGAISFGETTDDGVPIVHDTVLVFESVERVPPGGSAIARAWVLAPEHLPDDLGPGSTFTYVEGHRVVAHVHLLELSSDSTLLSDEKLTIIEARAAAATKGPWESYVEGRDHLGGDNFVMTGGMDDACPDLYLRHGSTPVPIEDQDFIAHARQDVPRLVAEVRRLRRLASDQELRSPGAGPDLE